jgi:plastocyanin
MKNKQIIFLALIFSITLISISTSSAYAATAYSISIPNGADAQNCSKNLNACFNPTTISVNVGDTIKWTNNDGTEHTTTSGPSGSPDGLWNSGVLTSGKSFTTTITKTGTLNYYCLLHPWQIGVVISTNSTQTLPTVSISTPADGSTFALNSTITFTGIASDSGSDLTSNIKWISNLDGSIGTGGTLSKILSEGVHTITASVNGTGGLGSQSIKITVGNPPPVIDPINTDPIPAKISKGDINIGLKLVASNLVAPMHLTDAGDGSGRLFIVDQPGQIWILKNDTVLSTPFLDISNKIVKLGLFNPPRYENDYDERGLLGLAFHPGFNDPNSSGYRKIYTYSSEPVNGSADFTVKMTNATGFPVPFDHQSVIAEWSINPSNPDLVDTNSRREIMRVDEPQLNHNGGMIQFGPDGYMYVAFGDGGQANDVGPGHGVTGNGQNTTNILGTIIRISPLDPTLTKTSTDSISINGKYRIPSTNPFVADPNKLDEIYAYGLRNAWRFSFDPAGNQLIAADVGQNKIEEIDVIKAGGNYGWNKKEGTFDFDPRTGSIINYHSPGFIDPVAQYDHDEGISITGGYVYRGSAIPELQGLYVFGDFSSGFFTPNGRLFYSNLATGTINEFVLDGGDKPLGQFVKSSGRDQNGEIYFLTGTNLGPFSAVNGTKFGQVLKVVPSINGGKSLLKQMSGISDELKSLKSTAKTTKTQEDLNESIKILKLTLNTSLWSPDGNSLVSKDSKIVFEKSSETISKLREIIKYSSESLEFKSKVSSIVTKIQSIEKKLISQFPTNSEIYSEFGKLLFK